MDKNIIDMKKKAFTLTELMVVAAIISVMSVVVIVSLGGSKTNKALEISAREIGATVREAQNNALTGKQPDSFKLACGHGIAKTGNDTYELFFNSPLNPTKDCSDANYIYNPAQSTVYVMKKLENKIKFTNPAVDSVYFGIPHGTVYDKNGNPAWRITLVSSADASRKYTICVYPSGNVEEKSGDVAC